MPRAQRMERRLIAGALPSREKAIVVGEKVCHTLVVGPTRIIAGQPGR